MMLDVQHSPETPRFAFEPHDEIIIKGVSYRPRARRERGYVFTRTDETGVAEPFDDGRLAQLVRKGTLVHRRGAFLEENARRRLNQPSSIVSAIGGRAGEAMKFRSAFVEAFLEFESSRRVK